MLKVLRVVVWSAFKSGKTNELLRESLAWAKERHWRKRPETGRKGRAGVIGGLLVAALVIGILLWMHQRLRIIEQRLTTIEERQDGNVSLGD